MNEYKKVLDYDPWLITDKYNQNNQHKGFVENRWDQSIFSLLGKTLGCVSVGNETHFKSKPQEQYDFPFLAVRKHGHGLKDSIKFSINYKKQYDEPAYFEDINNAVSIIDQIKPLKYNKFSNVKKQGNSWEEYGFIAQDVNKVLPDLGSPTKKNNFLWERIK